MIITAPQVLHASYQVKLSFLIANAKSSKAGFQSAKISLNTANIRLQKISLVNDRGVRHPFQVERVNDVLWDRVEFTERSGVFRVYAKFEFALKYCLDSQNSLIEMLQSGYTVPPSLVSDQPVLILPMLSRSYYTTVHEQSLIWKFDFPDPGLPAAAESLSETA